MNESVIRDMDWRSIERRILAGEANQADCDQITGWLFPDQRGAVMNSFNVLMAYSFALPSYLAPDLRHELARRLLDGLSLSQNTIETLKQFFEVDPPDREDHNIAVAISFMLAGRHSNLVYVLRKLWPDRLSEMKDRQLHTSKAGGSGMMFNTEYWP